MFFEIFSSLSEFLIAIFICVEEKRERARFRRVNNVELFHTRRYVGLLSEFLKSKQESRKKEEIQSQELSDFLSEFIVTVYSKRNASSEFSTHPMRTARLLYHFSDNFLSKLFY